MKSLPRIHRGMTLIELLVVIGIIMMLMAIVVPALASARRQRLILQAQREVKDILNAATLYYEAIGQYPPDTGNDGSPFPTGNEPEVAAQCDKYSIHRYLARPVTDSRTGVSHGPFLTASTNSLKDDAVGTLYVDPWGKPYLFDAMHSRVITTGADKGKVEVFGEPYPPTTDPEEEKLRVVDVKVWSSGPDKEYQNGSNVLRGKGEPVDPKDVDNITSWSTN